MKLASLFASILFPAHCAGCERPLEGTSESLCAECEREIPLFDSLFCGTCRARLPEDKKICHLGTPYLLGAAAPYDSEPARKLVEELKFRHIKPAALAMARIMRGYLRKINLDSHFRKESPVIVPIPLSRERLRERGFNQSELIARGLQAGLQLPIRTAALTRVKHSGPQSLLASYRERSENVAGVFRAVEHLSDIILVDDVTTSGATFREAARALKQNGARKILALSFARAGSF